jgi:SAM-dependent methyltransferase
LTTERPRWLAHPVLPIPPPEMRALVGRTDEASFDNPSGAPIFEECDTTGAVFDFGCGCGRLARQLIQQHQQPKRYLGVDLHRGMVSWCQANLTPSAPQFHFEHHDVYYAGFNPNAQRHSAPLPAGDGEFDLIIAISVFTHIAESTIGHYLRECARILRPDGVLRCTWFLFDKRYFPMMQEFQNALYINETDPCNAVIYDRDWLVSTLRANGLIIASASPPELRGFHWHLQLRPVASGNPCVELPVYDAPFGTAPPPVPPEPPYSIDGGGGWVGPHATSD